jgi:hypothetical protein
MEGAEFDELVADVDANGVREAIWIYQGQILDGRNRYCAAQEANVSCPTRIYDGNDPVGFVVSANIHRRHLNTSQRAMIAAKLTTLKDGQRADLVEGTSIEGAANLLNVGHASVERAKTVRERGTPELIAAVEAGDISVAGAVDEIRRGMVTGNVMAPYAERGLDCYETPDVATRALLRVEKFSGPIWEPAWGPGAIVSVLRTAGHRVVATDIEDYGCPGSKGGIDFLKQERAPDGIKIVLTNPPFMHAADFVRHALGLVPHVVMLQRLGFLASQGRSDILDGGQFARVHVFARRLPTMHRRDWTGPRVSSGMDTCWCIWDRHHRGPTVIDRISWEEADT